MSLSGIIREPVPYVVEDDRSSDSPTVFHIKPQTVRDSLRLANSVQRATTEKRGKTRFDDAKMMGVLLEEWAKVVVKIENYKIPKGAVGVDGNGEEDMHAKYEGRVDASAIDPKGVITINAISEEERRDVLKMLEPKYQQEVMDAADNASTLRGAEKN